MMSVGAARPCFMVGSSVMPPDMNLPSLAFFIGLDGIRHFGGTMIGEVFHVWFLPALLGSLLHGLHGVPHHLRRRRHGQIA